MRNAKKFKNFCVQKIEVEFGFVFIVATSIFASTQVVIFHSWTSNIWFFYFICNKSVRLKKILEHTKNDSNLKKKTTTTNPHRLHLLRRKSHKLYGGGGDEFFWVFLLIIFIAICFWLPKLFSKFFFSPYTIPASGFAAV